MSVGAANRRPSVLYLDQNAWIALARGAWDKVEHPDDHAALTVVAEALRAGLVVAPLSFTTQYETMKVDNAVRRTHLANVQATISGGWVLRGRRRILEVTLSRYIAAATGLQSAEVTADWFLSDLWFETAAEYSSGAFDEVISPAALEQIRRHPKETLFDYLAGTDDGARKEGVRRFSADSLALLARMTARRQRVAGESFALRLRAYTAHLMIDEIDFILAQGRQHGLPWRGLGDVGDKLARSLMTEVPVLNVERQLAARLEDQPRAMTENDLRDMGAFVSALPLVDIMVAEKQFVNLSRQAKLGAQYGTRLLTSIHDLTGEMFAPSDETSCEP